MLQSINLQGGPLVIQEDDGHWYLAGLISKVMCTSSNESMYTDMSRYMLVLSS